jgi:hypothetical protein
MLSRAMDAAKVRPARDHYGSVGYELAPMTWKSWLTKMWWGQLTPM